MILTEQDLMNINGGAKYSLIAAFGAIGVFIVGVVDGLNRLK